MHQPYSIALLATHTPRRHAAPQRSANGRATQGAADVARAEPVYEAMPGWEEDVTGVRTVEDLPDNARRYIDRIESLTEVPAAFISVGPGRDETIMCQDLFE